MKFHKPFWSSLDRLLRTPRASVLRALIYNPVANRAAALQKVTVAVQFGATGGITLCCCFEVIEDTWLLYLKAVFLMQGMCAVLVKDQLSLSEVKDRSIWILPFLSRDSVHPDVQIHYLPTVVICLCVDKILPWKWEFWIYLCWDRGVLLWETDLFQFQPLLLLSQCRHRWRMTPSWKKWMGEETGSFLLNSGEKMCYRWIKEETSAITSLQSFCCCLNSIFVVPRWNLPSSTVVVNAVW